METKISYQEKGKTGCTRTYSGIYIDPFNPDPNLILIEDIAHALSNLCRFGGHSERFYSVAQHAVRCSYEIENPEEALEALCHDNTEGYLVDLPAPIKRRIPLYEEKEELLMKVIFDKFKLKYPLSPSVKDVDRKLLQMEIDEVMLGKNVLDYWSPEKAKAKFLSRFYELLNERYGREEHKNIEVH